MKNLICKIATIEEIEQKWNEEIIRHPSDEKWTVWKNRMIKNVKNQTRISYYGILEGKMIAEGTAIISANDENLQQKELLVKGKTAYLMGFRTLESFQGRGYFSQLYKFIENDLAKKGFKKLIIAVEPCEVKNMQIYFKWGYKNFIKIGYEIYPPAVKNGKQEKKVALYYSKEL